MNRLHKENYKGYTISIFPDEDAGSPREEYDNLGHMVCFHRRSNYGDKHEFRTPEELIEFMQKEQPVFAPIFAYEHGGIALSTSNQHYPFNDQWDAGWLGVIYVTKEEIAREYGGSNLLTSGNDLATTQANPAEHTILTDADILERVRLVLEGEIKVYNQWLNGEFCGYVVSKDGDDVDSTWGYESIESAVEAAKEHIDWEVENAGL